MKKATLLFVFALSLNLLSSQSALAVPIPWKNCGKPTDIVNIQLFDVSRWPIGIAGPPSPLYVIASLNPEKGWLDELRVAELPLNWVFVLKGPFHSIHDKDGFVALPSSWQTNGSPPLTLTTSNFRDLPNLKYLNELPVPAGPLTASDVIPPLTASGLPLALTMKATVGQNISGLLASFWVSYNGRLGFPIKPTRGSVFETHLQITDSATGAEVLCMNMTIPNDPVVVIERVPLHKFRLIHSRRGRFLRWAYGREGRTLSSKAMRPSIECSNGLSKNATYSRITKTWWVKLGNLEQPEDCREVFVRSPLTGQVDGPFWIERSTPQPTF